MRTTRGGKPSARLNCESLEAREVPAVAFALQGTNLLAFDTAAPAAVTTTPITGIVAGETLVGIDFRPQNGQLYGLGVNPTPDTATLYAISIRTGIATPVGAASAVALVDAGGAAVALPDPATVGYGLDFNPAVDRFRVIAGNLNFRINPNNGLAVDGDAVAAGTNPDTDITPAGIDASATAYTNNMPNNGNITTQYLLDEAGNALVPLANPNGGTTGTAIPLTLGGAPFDLGTVNGFDIPAGVNATASNTPVTAGSAFVVSTVGGASVLYSLDLVTGALTSLGTIPGAAISGLAIQNDYGPGFPAVALGTGGTSIVRFNTATPGTAVTAAIPAAGMTGGPLMGDVLVGIDYRPQTGQLFALGVNTANNTIQLYLVTPQTVAPGTDTASVTAVGAPITGATVGMGVTFPAGGFGFDFNPSVDRIRVTTQTGLNFRLNPNTGAFLANDGLTNGNGSTGVSAAAYTNAFGQVLGGVNPTTLYTLDAATNTLFIQSPPNSATQSAPKPVTLGGMPLDFTDVSGFDIPAGTVIASPNAGVTFGFGYAALTVGAATNLYRIDLATGVATLITGALPAGTTGLSLADAPGGVVSFAAATGTADEGGSFTITINRTAGSGPQTVLVNVTGGSASAGSDVFVGPYTVVLPDGASSATLTLPVTADLMTEGTETLVVTLSAAGGVIGGIGTATLTINDTSLTPPAPPAPAPFYSSATVVGGNLVLQGAGVASGTQVVPLPPGSSVFFADLSGDGKSDLIIITPALAVVQDGQTGRFLALAADVTGDGVRDLLIFNANGTTTTTDGRTGIAITR